MEDFDRISAGNSDSFRAWLEQETGLGVDLAITDNSTRMISVRGGGGAVSVRIHRIFLSAPRDILKEVASFVKNRRAGTPLIRSYIKERGHFIKERAVPRTSVRTRGEHHDLQAVFDSLNAGYFGSSVRARITWGRSPARRRVRIRTLGSYSCLSGVIRINPLLDSGRVPGYFVAFVVYHEMLHAHMGVAAGPTDSGRRSIHPKEFRERERLFADYSRAAEWERSNRVS